jgi:CBS domain-containing protein
MAEHYASKVVTASADTPVRELAALMRSRAVGTVVIVDADARPVGIVTDRDLCCRIVARRMDAEGARAAGVMSQPLHTASPDEPIEALVARMREHGVRRLPVVRDGRLHGLVSLDDLLVWVSAQVDDLAQATQAGIETATQQAQRGARRGRIRELAQRVFSTGH